LGEGKKSPNTTLINKTAVNSIYYLVISIKPRVTIKGRGRSSREAAKLLWSKSHSPRRPGLPRSCPEI
jgi:hypothetical protein